MAVRPKMPLLIVLCLTTLACSISYDLANRPTGQIIEVNAEEGWTDTGLTVREGSLLTITYLSGKWSPWPGGEYDATGSGGDPTCRCNVMEAVSHAALIGRIGNHEPFLVGRRFQHTVGETGRLHLGINDVDLYDNSGYLRVLVEIE
jgi:hypothetical protein